METLGQSTATQGVPEKGGSMLIFGAGNGASNILAELDKDTTFTDEDFANGLLKMYATDPDDKKLKDALSDCKRVTQIKLIDDPRFAAGTGAKIMLGAQYAIAKRAVFEKIAQDHAAINGNVLLIGCLGGGSTGILPVVARIFKKAGLQVSAVVTMPEPKKQGGARNNNALIVLRELQLAGVSVTVLYNNRVTHKPDAKLGEIYKLINQTVIIPMLKTLRVIYQDTSTVINLDNSDLANVQGTTKYVSYYIRGEQFHTDEKIGEILTTNPLQDWDKILPVSTVSVMDFHGDFWTADRMDNVTDVVVSKMCKVIPLSNKAGVNERDRFGNTISVTDSWVALITSADIMGEEPVYLPGLETYHSVIKGLFEEVPVAKELGIEPEPEAARNFVSTVPEPIAFTPQIVDESECVPVSLMMEGLFGSLKRTDPKTIKLPLVLKQHHERLKSTDFKLLTPEMFSEFHDLSAPYIERMPGLSGWKIFFPQEKNMFTPSKPHLVAKDEETAA